MIIPTPTKYFMAHGCAEGMSELNAFDAALMNAGVGNTNLVRMSSILPPRCEEVASIELASGRAGAHGLRVRDFRCAG